MIDEAGSINEVVIDESNFSDYFTDVSNGRPKPGQVMARFVAMADLVAGDLKTEVIRFMCEREGGARSAIQLLRRKANATEKASVIACKQIVEDLISGETVEEVYQKPYRFKLEKFYYVDRELVPKNNPHWELISLVTPSTSPSEVRLT